MDQDTGKHQQDKGLRDQGRTLDSRSDVHGLLKYDGCAVWNRHCLFDNRCRNRSGALLGLIDAPCSLDEAMAGQAEFELCLRNDR